MTSRPHVLGAKSSRYLENRPPKMHTYESFFCPRRRSGPAEMHKIPIRRRKQITLVAELCSFISIGATALVLLGNTHLNTAVDQIYFLKLDTSSAYPPQHSEFADSIMRYITDLSGAKLAHFYQIGLWNHCEGYEDKGVTYCSAPSLTHYFNPVDMMISKALPVKYGKLFPPQLFLILCLFHETYGPSRL